MAGRGAVRCLEQTDGPDPPSTPQPAPEGTRRLQHLGRQLRFAVRAARSRGYEAGARGVRPRPEPAGGEVAHDAQEQVGQGDALRGRGSPTGVRRDPAEGRDGGVQVHAGAQDGQFPLVGGAEIGLDVAREVLRGQPGEQFVPLPGSVGEMPQQGQRPVAYGTQFGCDREG
ncbi:hypothetical protein SGRI78S_07343 [Streptomyces griseus subsp. griseus]